jgi:hypothetical protein
MMLTIRLAKNDWAKAWRAMIELAPVRLVADDPMYEVLPAHLELLTSRGFAYEVMPTLPLGRRKDAMARPIRNVDTYLLHEGDV